MRNMFQWYTGIMLHVQGNTSVTEYNKNDEKKIVHICAGISADKIGPVYKIKMAPTSEPMRAVPAVRRIQLPLLTGADKE